MGGGGGGAPGGGGGGGAGGAFLASCARFSLAEAAWRMASLNCDDELDEDNEVEAAATGGGGGA